MDGNRIGVGFLAALQAVMFGLFQLLAQAALLLAQVLLRVVILLGPVIGLVAILHHDLLRGVGRAVGAALLNIAVLSVLAALHTLVMVWVFDPSRNLSVLAQMLLGGMITLVLLLIARPIRRMWQMTELAVGAVGGGLPSSPPGVLARLRRRQPGAEATASERFWEEARGTEADPGAPTADFVAGSRGRPEAGALAAIPVLAPGRLGGSGQGSSAAELTSSSEGMSRPDRLAALPSGFSLTGPGRAQSGEEAVYVPSALQDARGAPRQAELEEVAGQSVWVVYRPSAGLQVGPEVGADGTGSDSAWTTD